jgi:hypothetical protein
MQKITIAIDEALKLISTLTVSGDAVDVVAAAKSLLRNANAEIKKLDIANNEIPE